MEEFTDVKAVLVDFKCPKCKNGYLRHTGMVLTSYPPQYPHICNNKDCGYGETFSGGTYPKVEYKPIKKKSLWNFVLSIKNKLQRSQK